ncbi:MAG: DUF1934 domain-containing protein [Intestinibacillus sp.]
MKKNVLVAISSTQHFEGCDPEQIDLVTCALLYERGGAYYIVYDESALTGLEGTRTTVKLDGRTVLMRRAGTYPSQMLFVENQRHVGLYETGYGAMTVATHTSRVRNTVGDNGGELAIDYTVEVDNNVAGEHHFEMVVTPQ